MSTLLSQPLKLRFFLFKCLFHGKQLLKFVRIYILRWNLIVFARFKQLILIREEIHNVCLEFFHSNTVLLLPFWDLFLNLYLWLSWRYDIRILTFFSNVPFNQRWSMLWLIFCQVAQSKIRFEAFAYFHDTTALPKCTHFVYGLMDSVCPLYSFDLLYFLPVYFVQRVFLNNLSCLSISVKQLSTGSLTSLPEGR